MPNLILGGIVCFSVPAFILISGSSSIHFSAVIIFANLIGVGVMAITVCFHFAAQFNKLSISTLRKFRKNHFRKSSENISSAHSKKLIRKHLRSMKPLKIKFLHCNYFDRLTPLVFLKLSMRLAIQFTLINKWTITRLSIVKKSNKRLCFYALWNIILPSEYK